MQRASWCTSCHCNSEMLATLTSRKLSVVSLSTVVIYALVSLDWHFPRINAYHHRAGNLIGHCDHAVVLEQVLYLLLVLRLQTLTKRVHDVLSFVQ